MWDWEADVQDALKSLRTLETASPRRSLSPETRRVLLEHFKCSLEELVPEPSYSPRIPEEELDRIYLKQVRPHVEVGQTTVLFDDPNGSQPVELKLFWLERWGGTFGSTSSAEAMSKRFRSSIERLQDREAARAGAQPPSGRLSDRGKVPAYLLYFQCPKCSRRCRVINSRQGTQDYGCSRCVRPSYHSIRVTGRGGIQEEGKPTQDRIQHRHFMAAARIRRDYLGDDLVSQRLETFKPRPEILPRPKGMQKLRFEALIRLVDAHESLGMLAGAGYFHGFPATDQAMKNIDADQAKVIDRQARHVLKMDAWALRQKSWHRKGLPRRPETGAGMSMDVRRRSESGNLSRPRPR